MSRCALIALLVGIAWAGGVDPPFEGHFLGARSLATAGAVVVGAQGTEALFMNPAGRLGAHQACAGAVDLSCGRSVLWAGGVVPKGGWSMSLGWASASVDDIALRNEQGIRTGSACWRTHRIAIGLARRVDFLTRCGLDVHYLRVDAAGSAANGLGLDVGVVRLILPPLLAVGGAVHDGLSRVAYGGDSARRETIRPRVTAGVKVGLAQGAVQFEWDMYRRAGWSRWKAAVGLQAALGRGLAARLGYGESGVSAGVSLSSGQVGIGLAMMPDGLGTSGRGVEATWTRDVE